MTTIAYQLYCSRNFPPLEDTLSMLADAGYSAVEGYGGLYDDVGALRSALDKAGLTMPSGHFALEVVEDDPDRAIGMARALGVSKMFVPYLDADKRPTDVDGWRGFANRLVEAGKPMQDAGLVFGWHNHDFEYADLGGGVRPIDCILEAGANIAWEADIAWIVRGGNDPIAEIERHGERIAAVHVKETGGQVKRCYAQHQQAARVCKPATRCESMKPGSHRWTSCN